MDDIHEKIIIFKIENVSLIYVEAFSKKHTVVYWYFTAGFY